MPGITPWISLALLVIGLGTPIFLAVKKHWQSFHQAECTREKMVRSLGLDLSGFFLTMGAATFLGGAAGGYVSLRAGFWLGLLAGFTGGFLATWAARSMWGRLVVERA
jgi:hypothetical protein